MQFLPYGRQCIEDDDVAAVVQVLRGDWLTSGPSVTAFENALAARVGAGHAVACNSGTAALYIASLALGLGPGDTVIVPAITFLATASANVLAGIDVVFADVDPDTGLMTVEHAEAALGRAGGRARAVFPVHLGGQAEDPAALAAFARANGLFVVEDACHALGTRFSGGEEVGGCAHSDITCFSFHPVKTIAMGEGGAVTTNDPVLAERCRLLRNHGMNRDPESWVADDLSGKAEGVINPWYYEARDISHNFRVSDINCALGLSQLGKLDRFAAARRDLVAVYRRRLSALGPAIVAVPERPGMDEVGWHLFCVLVDFDAIGKSRRVVMDELKARGIGTQVHYVPVHLQPFYRECCATPALPGALAYYRRTLSLPLFPTMTEADVDRVVAALAEVVAR